MGTWGPAWAGAATYKQDGEGVVVPPVFLMLAGGDQGTGPLVRGEEEREQQISLAPLSLLSQSTGPPFL